MSEPKGFHQLPSGFWVKDNGSGPYFMDVATGVATAVGAGDGGGSVGTTLISASRALTQADNGKTLQFTAPNLTVTIPAGLANFGFAVIPNGATAVAFSGGAKGNGAATPIVRTAIGNTMFGVVPLADSADSYLVTDLPGRVSLTAALTYYVATTGNDTTGAGTLASPWLTVQRALNAAALLDFAGFAVTIQVADGTYTTAASITIPVTTGQRLSSDLLIQGNMSTWGVVMNGPGNFIPTVITAPIARCKIQGFTFKAATANGIAVQADAGGVIDIQSVVFGANHYSHLYATAGGLIRPFFEYSITAAATNHVATAAGGIVKYDFGVAVTVTNTPAFTAFALAQAGQIDANGLTFTGSATGTRYSCVLGGSINAYGAGVNIFPGSVAGSSAGGYYA